jgi:hypothetical protein
MASFNKFNQFVGDLASGVHQLQTGTSHVLKIMLTNTAPVATNAVYADVSGAEVANGNGYTTGGISVGTITGSQTSGTFTLSGGTNPKWTSSTGNMGPFRYAILYNTTPSSPLKPLIGWWDYGSSVTLNGVAGETFEVDEVSSLLTLS